MKQKKNNNIFIENSNGKSSKDCTKEEIIKIYLSSIPNKEETPEERLKRINDFRCGW